MIDKVCNKPRTKIYDIKKINGIENTFYRPGKEGKFILITIYSGLGTHISFNVINKEAYLKKIIEHSRLIGLDSTPISVYEIVKFHVGKSFSFINGIEESKNGLLTLNHVWGDKIKLNK